MKNKVLIITGIILLFTGGIAGSERNPVIPPLEQDAITHLNNSPRHGEWVTFHADTGDKVNAWLVYPERKDKAPVVIVIHEIYGLTDWVRAVADQFAAEGFIAIAPDFLSGKGPGGKGSAGLSRDDARGLIPGLEWDEIQRRIKAAIAFGTSLPAADKKFGIVGYCWGGGISFSYATTDTGLGAAVVFYGTSPETNTLKNITAPVLGLYGQNDNRVNSTIPEAEKELKKPGKRYEYEIYDGAGHGFLRAQDGGDGANLLAAKKAWARTIAFFKETLEK